ncbi:MAG: YihA family ribosome biogenesis GTP-binding protein [Cyclobacteriaceae bacterium]|nr:YihA family ribosome biogenesis GTP-binding protein [Cyclobacteriaceae bacterium]
MKVRSAVFEKSVTKVKDCPSTGFPEVAFIGRSNVGKSSLINLLFERKKLAKTSATPGKTQTINYFLINRNWCAVDLPGYGWAKVSRDKKLAWSGFVREYLLSRENLMCLFVLLDIRLEPQPIDLQFLNWTVEQKIPIALVFTKSDKLPKNKIIGAVEKYESELKKHWEFLPEIFITSAEDKTGRNDLLIYIDSILKD